MDRHRNVVHDLPGIPRIRLQQYWLQFFCRFASGLVVEYPLRPVIHLVDLGVSG